MPFPYMILTIIVNDAPYGIEKPWNAFRLASTSSTEEIGMKVKDRVRQHDKVFKVEEAGP